MILVSGYIKNQSGQPIPSASIQVVDGTFNLTGEGTAANGMGFFSLYINELLWPYGLSVSSVGYKPTVVKLSTFINNSTITLATNVVDLPPVVVTSGDNNKYLWWIALAGGAWILLKDDKKKGVGKIDIYKYYKGLPQWGKAVAILGAGTVTYFTLKKLLKAQPGKPTVEETNEEITQSAETPSFSNSQYLAWASQIRTQFSGCDTQGPWFDGFTGSGRTVNNVFKQLIKNIDFLKLVSAFGVSTYDQCGVWPFATTFTGNLYSAINDELTTGEISKLNSTLASRGITYKV